MHITMSLCMCDLRTCNDDKMRSVLIFLFALAFVRLSSGVAIQVPSTRTGLCDTFLRLLYPEKFYSYCCKYSEWSEWSVVPDSVVSIDTAACVSGEAYNETRTRTAASEGCDPQTETRRTCLPDREDRLILALGLGNLNGGSNNPSEPRDSEDDTLIDDEDVHAGAPLAGSGTLLRNGRSYGSGSGVFPRPRGCAVNSGICDRFEVWRGKRSLHGEHEAKQTKGPFKRKQTANKPHHSSDTPLPFDWNKHRSRFRRQLEADCSPDGTQYVLFLLDTSGSIGNGAFERMKTAISNLTALFCKPVKIGVLTFDHNLKLEFCFNCFGSDWFGRSAARKAIRHIPYRGGWTHTAGATLCACKKLLRPGCGLHEDANCIDVVYITDGKSNDPTREVCNEVKCLHKHNRYRNHINTYAIGIKNYDEREMQCIAHSSSISSVFQFKDFNDFEYAIRKIIARLFVTVNDSESPSAEALPASRQYDCANRDE